MDILSRVNFVFLSYVLDTAAATFWTLPTPELIPESSEANYRPKMPRLWSQPS